MNGTGDGEKASTGTTRKRNVAEGERARIVAEGEREARASRLAGESEYLAGETILIQ
jgi:hypothetical protein